MTRRRLPIQTPGSDGRLDHQEGGYHGGVQAGTAMPPTAHNHPISDVTGLQTALDGKEDDGVAAALIAAQNAVTKNHTGFKDPDLVVVDYDPATRKVTLTGTVEAYYQGVQVTALTSGWVSDAHPAGATQPYFLYYNGSAFVWSTTSWSFSEMMICLAVYDSAGTFRWALRETHGLMGHETHKELHAIQGTYLVSGGDLSAYTIGSTTAAQRRPDVAATTVADEDLLSTLPQLTSKSYTLHYLTGAGSSSAWTVGAAEILPVTGAQPYWNQFTGGAWQQTAVAVGDYACVFQVAVPTAKVAGADSAYRYIWLQGQTSGSLATVQAETFGSMNLGQIGSLSPEYVCIGKVIIRYIGGNWSFTSAEKITLSKGGASSSGNFLTAVTTDTTLTGAGTATLPLGVETTSESVRIRACVLTGLVAAAGTIAATDTILQAFNKTEYRLALNDAKVSFPGFGTDHVTAAYGDHLHTGVYQPLDGDLTAIAALSGTTGFLKKTAANTWSLDTTSYLSGTKVDSFNTRTGAVTLSSSDVTTALTYTPYQPGTALSATSGAFTANMSLTASDARFLLKGGSAVSGFLIEQDATKAAYVWNYESTALTFGTSGVNRGGISAAGAWTTNGNSLTAGPLYADTGSFSAGYVSINSAASTPYVELKNAGVRRFLLLNNSTGSLTSLNCYDSSAVLTNTAISIVNAATGAITLHADRPVSMGAATATSLSATSFLAVNRIGLTLPADLYQYADASNAAFIRAYQGGSATSNLKWQYGMNTDGVWRVGYWNAGALVDAAVSIAGSTGGAITFSSARAVTMAGLTADYIRVLGSTSNDGSLCFNSVAGLKLQAKAGSSYDASLLTPGAAAYVWLVPTGTNHFRMLGNTAIIGTTNNDVALNLGVGSKLTASTGANQYGLLSDICGNTSGTSGVTAGAFRARSDAAAYSVTFLMGARIFTPIIGAGSTVTANYGLYIESQAGAGTGYAIYTNTGLVRFGDAVTIASGSLTIPAGQYLYVSGTGAYFGDGSGLTSGGSTAYAVVRGSTGVQLNVGSTPALTVTASTVVTPGTIKSTSTYGWTLGSVPGEARVEHTGGSFYLLTSGNAKAALDMGALSASTGTFTGALTATTGDFSGVVNILGGSSLGLTFRSNFIQTEEYNGSDHININYRGYLNGTTQFRNFRVYDGKQTSLLVLDGETKNAVFSGMLQAASIVSLGDISGGGVNTHTQSYSVATGTYVTINVATGTNALAAGKAYRVRLVTTGTSTATGAVYVAYQISATPTFAIKLVSDAGAGAGTNLPRLRLNASLNGLEVYHNHASTYSINTIVETFSTGNVTAIGPHFFGLEGSLTRTDTGLSTSDPVSMGALTTTTLVASATGAHTFGATAGAATTYIQIRSAAGYNRGLLLATGANVRWYLFADNGAESGSNAGSNLKLQAYDDGGTSIDIPITIVRAAAGAISFSVTRPVAMGALSATTGTFAGSVTGVTEATSDSSTKFATTAWVKAQGYGTPTGGSATWGNITGTLSQASPSGGWSSAATFSSTVSCQGLTATTGTFSSTVTGTSFNSITGLASVAPLIDGASAAVGTSTAVARQDHVHPRDTSREPALGNPASNGYVLSSTTAGVRSWIAMSAYTHPTGDGNLHVPATSTTNNGKVLQAGSTAGSISWQAIVQFPGFGTTHVLAAYGDHVHTGVYQPIDADLTAIAALSYTATAFLKKTALNTWALDTTVYQTLDADLTAIAALGYTATSFLKKTAANTWALDTTAYQVSNTNLDAIAGLSAPSTGLVRKTGSGTFDLLSETTYQPLDTSLTSIASLSGNGLLIMAYDGSVLLQDTNTYQTYDDDLAAIAYLTTGTAHGLLKRNALGVWALLDEDTTYQPFVAAGTTSQWWRGDKTWQAISEFPGFGTSHSTAAYGDHTHTNFGGLTVSALTADNIGVTGSAQDPLSFYFCNIYSSDGLGVFGNILGHGALKLSGTLTVGMSVDVNGHFSGGYGVIHEGNIADQSVQSAVSCIYSARATDNGNLVGMVQMYAGTAAPPYWMFCDGRELSRTVYSALFAVIGTTYGAGDGSTTFNIPNLMGRSPMGGTLGGRGPTDANGDDIIVTLGVAIGEYAHTLTEWEMPVHAHSNGYAQEKVANNGGWVAGMNGAINTGTAGGGQPHDNIHPVLGINFIIRYDI